MDSDNFFSDNYLEARQRFLKAAQAVHAVIKSHPISSRGSRGEELTIDIATLGAKNPDRTILLTCGLHGVEGFLGSAIQTAWLEGFLDNPVSFGTTAVVLVHALNPFGFYWQRRVNENNVDLNRNFLLDKQFYGSHPSLKKIAWLQRPASPNNKFFIIELYALWTILFYGFTTMRNCLLLGQYDYPLGLFWGGHQFEETTQIVKEQIDSWTKQSPHILHIDYHSGIGKYGCCNYLTFGQDNFKGTLWFLAKFGADATSFLTQYVTGGKPEGGMGDLISHHFEARKIKYTYIPAEYGTYSFFRGFKALYQENRFYNHPGNEYESARRNLKEFFCPADPIWRKKCVADGLAMISKALQIIEEI